MYDGRRRERISRARVACDVREIQALAGTQQELEKGVLVAFARGYVAGQAVSPAEVKRVFGVHRRKAALRPCRTRRRREGESHAST